MQTAGKIRRSVAKLQQLRDDWYKYPRTDLTLWLVNRTEETRNELPPGLRKTGLLPAVVALTPNGSCEYYILPDQQLPADFVAMLKRTDQLLADAGLVPDYAYDKTLYAVTKLAIQGRITIHGSITKETQHYWQGETTFAVSFGKVWPKSWRVPLACLDWFVEVPRLAEAVGDTIDELLAGLEPAAAEQPTQAAAETPTQPAAAEPSKPKRSRKKPAVDPKKKQQEIAFEFLKLWHRYDEDSFNSDPIPEKSKWQQWMLERSPENPVPSPPTVTRMLRKKLGGNDKYLVACRNGRIKELLTVAAGDAVRVYREQLDERSTTDAKPDLD